ncbi:hypothetical protein [Brevundimonas denitrificans]|nr:hypothetical protein [Brevundimonas denitrificans]
MTDTRAAARIDLDPLRRWVVILPALAAMGLAAVLQPGVAPVLAAGES